MKITHIQNQLFKDNNSLIKFQFPIAEFKLIENFIIVLLDVPLDIVLNENLFCIDLNGAILWQIEKIKHIYNDSTFTNIIIDKNNNIQSYNQDGFMYTINIYSGKIIEKRFLK